MVATGLLVVTPGATTAVVVRNALVRGHRAGIHAACGAAVANTLHATLAGVGLWVLVGRWPVVLETLRMGGAAYLAWLGLQSLLRVVPWRTRVAAGSPFDASAHPPVATPPPRTGFVEGLTVNILNPAIISFYLAVVPTFVPPDPPRYFFLLLATTHVTLAFLCHAGWATAFHVLRRVFARPGVRIAFELGSAAALLWLAARAIH